MKRLGILLLMLFLVACAGLPTPLPPTPTPFIIHPEAALPGDVLLVYNREGGWENIHTILTLHNSGLAEIKVLSNPNNPPDPFQKTVSASDLAAIQAILNNPDLLTLNFGVGGGCGDCYIYSVTARTPSGIIKIGVDDSMLGTPDLSLYQTLVNKLEAVYKQ